MQTLKDFAKKLKCHIPVISRLRTQWDRRKRYDTPLYQNNTYILVHWNQWFLFLFKIAQLLHLKYNGYFWWRILGNMKWKIAKYLGKSFVRRQILPRHHPSIIMVTPSIITFVIWKQNRFASRVQEEFPHYNYIF